MNYLSSVLVISSYIWQIDESDFVRFLNTFWSLSNDLNYDTYVNTSEYSLGDFETFHLISLMILMMLLYCKY